MKFLPRLFLGILFCSFSIGSAQTEQPVTTGYQNGTLIVIGGGKLDPGIMATFLDLAGGESAKLVVIPTAGITGAKIDSSRILKPFKNFGFKHIRLLHTNNPEVANDPEFVKPLQEATALFFTGGRQWRIADGFLNTLAHNEMFKLLDRGGVIAGSSAGATIQGSYLARGDTRNNQIMMGDHEEGLGFISNIAIDQHVLVRNRQFDLFQILNEKPELFGVGIDESTAMIVKQDTFTVAGPSYVLVYDTRFWSREGSRLKKLPPGNQLFYFLKAGDRYDLVNRKVIKD